MWNFPEFTIYNTIHIKWYYFYLHVFTLSSLRSGGKILRYRSFSRLLLSTFNPSPKSFSSKCPLLSKHVLSFLLPPRPRELTGVRLLLPSSPPPTETPPVSSTLIPPFVPTRKANESCPSSFRSFLSEEKLYVFGQE